MLEKSWDQVPSALYYKQVLHCHMFVKLHFCDINIQFLVKCPCLRQNVCIYGHLTVKYKIEQHCLCHLQTYLTVDFSLVMKDICPCTELVNYVRSAFISYNTRHCTSGQVLGSWHNTNPKIVSVITLSTAYFIHNANHSTVKPVYNGHPWDPKKWPLYIGGR